MGAEEQENRTVYVRDCATGDQCINDEYSRKKRRRRRRRRRRRELEDVEVASFSYDYCCKESKCNGIDTDSWWSLLWNEFLT